MIKNEAKITNDVEVNINRAAIEHRATWMGLIFDELRKDAEITRIGAGLTPCQIERILMAGSKGIS